MNMSTDAIRGFAALCGIAASIVILVPDLSMWSGGVLRAHAAAMRIFWCYSGQAFVEYWRVFRLVRRIPRVTL